MEENQTNQNLNQQQPVQPVQPQPEQVQQPVQWQPVQQQPQATQQPVQWQPQTAEQPSVSMEIQQLLVQQQQYQKQYNELVDYVKKTPNLPLDQVNQIKVQLDQLNALFVEWKQKLQALGYNQVQVNKPTEVKKWSVANFSWRKVAIWCLVVLVLIFAWFFITLSSLIKNPNALAWIWVYADTAKMLLQAFTGLIFWSVILLMLWVIISNIYRLITVKNQSKLKFVGWLFGWLVWAIAMWALIRLVFWWISKIQTVVEEKNYDAIQPYLVWRVENEWEDEFRYPYDDKDINGVWENYKLITPSEFAFSLRQNEFNKLINERIPSESKIVNITLSCGNWSDKELDLMKDEDWRYVPDSYWWYKFQWTCLYSEKWTYTYAINVTYDRMNKERNTDTFTINSLNFLSEISISKTTTESSSSNNITTKLSGVSWEFIAWKAPAKITVDSTQVFRDFGLWSYEVEWDMDWDFASDRVNQTNFDFSYKIPQVYYVTFKFPGLSDDVWYRFPIRVEQSDLPVCWINTDAFIWTTRYQISSEFIDPADAAKISSYNYTIKNATTNKVYEVLKDQPQEFNFTFPEKWSFVVILDYVTIDGKQWQCESDIIQLKKETFDVQYSILSKNDKTWKFKEICSSSSSEYDGCKKFELSTFPQTYQLQIKSITPNSNTMKKVVSLNGTAVLNENDNYTFDIVDEWEYNLEIITSDVAKGMEEEIIEIKILADKPDIVWILSIMSDAKDPDKRVAVSEWFEPLTVILDASKTEINVPWDEVIYFTWDFGDWEVKTNQQNWVIVHTYNYDYVNENWIFEPKVTVRTRWWLTDVISWPVLNVKKWLINVDISSPSHPSRQAPTGTEVSFSAEFDWLPEKMIWDFGDGTSSVSCQWRTCTEISHTFKNTWIFSVNVSLEFDAVQQVDGNMDFKVY